MAGGIALNIIEPFDIETFDGLSAYIIALLELDAESQEQITTFIRQGEYRLDRLLTVPQREASISLSTTEGEQSVSLPIDGRSVRNAYITGSLKQVSLSVLHENYSHLSGKPVVYSIADQSMLFGPIPDATHTVRVTYMTRLPPLSASNQTNWLLANNADAYIYATLIAANVWLENWNAAAAARGELFSIIEEVNKQGAEYRAGGSLSPQVSGTP